MLRDAREEWYDEGARVAITIADVTSAAQQLARNHLSGPVSAYFLARSLAAAALLGGETSEPDETLSIQMKCSGPLGGLNVECTAAGTLRGYTDRKTLDDFDGMGKPDTRKVLGTKQLQVTRSVPGRIIAQGVATTLNGYLSQSLQRNAEIRLEAVVTDEVEVVAARGVMIEVMPDAPTANAPGSLLIPAKLSLNASSRTILKHLGHERSQLRKTTPLAFACRCSPERAASMIAALGDDERRELPPAVDVTCHMCGRTFTIATGNGGDGANKR